MQFLQFQGIKNLEWFGVGKEELPGLATPWSSFPCIRKTSMHPDELPTSRPLTSCNWNTSPHPDHFSASGTTSLYSIQRPSLRADHCNSSVTLPYIRTTFPCIQTISLYQDHFPTSGQFPCIQPTCFFSIHLLYNKQPFSPKLEVVKFNTLKAELNPISHLLPLLGAHHILHVGMLRVNFQERKLLTKLIFPKHNFQVVLCRLNIRV
jgi:hypothetical protein